MPGQRQPLQLLRLPNTSAADSADWQQPQDADASGCCQAAAAPATALRTTRRAAREPATAARTTRKGSADASAPPPRFDDAPGVRGRTALLPLASVTCACRRDWAPVRAMSRVCQVTEMRYGPARWPRLPCCHRRAPPSRALGAQAGAGAARARAGARVAETPAAGPSGRGAPATPAAPFTAARGPRVGEACFSQTGAPPPHMPPAARLVPVVAPRPGQGVRGRHGRTTRHGSLWHLFSA